MGRTKQAIAILLLLAVNGFIWSNAGRKVLEVVDVCYDEQTQQFSAPPLTFSMQAFPRLPQHLQDDHRGKTRLLYQDYFEIHGHPLVPRSQGSSSSCVGQSAACAIDVLGAVETKAGHRALPPPARASASWIYGCSREVGGIEDRGRGSYSRLAVRSLEEIGFLYEDYYFMFDLDLRGDNDARDKQFRSGVPDELLPLAVENRIAGYYLLNSYEDVRDAICAGMPVVVGSRVGFGKNSQVIWRDSDGFLDQPRFKFRGRFWAHAMCFIGVCDNGRKGVLCMNSWGAHWVDGPQRFGDEPLGSFWIDDEVVDKMVFHGDCFCIYGLSDMVSACEPPASAQAL